MKMEILKKNENISFKDTKPNISPWPNPKDATPLKIVPTKDRPADFSSPRQTEHINNENSFSN